ncbi:hypothetical protein [Peribacillus butanolivorans]|uniref:hypothetical protein n=1 Tax=Peribacillus butanolivorans TaxID=421767 RepID=UPI0036730A7F
MIELSEGNSSEFTRIMNVVIDDIFSHFMEVGSNLDYEEIYSTVFPEHKQDDQISGKHDLKTLHRYIRDDFHHILTPLYEYVLYNVMYFVYEASDDGFNLDDIISEQLTLDTIRKLDDEDTLKLLKNTHTPYDVIGIIFEDIDFLEVGKMFEIYRNQPEVVTNFLHVDLDYYEELMPEDIKTEYQVIKNNITVYQPDKVEEYDNIQFKEVVIKMVQDLKHIIEHNKGYKLLNYSGVKSNEKDVQIFFNIMANLYLKDTNILVSQEVDLGRGCVDFYFSIGKKYRALIELKLDKHQRFADGINYQLPTYLMAEGVDFGIFVLICYSEHEFDNSKKLFENAKELSSEYEKDIRFERIDASGTLKSASMIKNKTEMGFEGLS